MGAGAGRRTLARPENPGRESETWAKSGVRIAVCKRQTAIFLFRRIDKNRKIDYYQK
jgi:hypothetical protein